MDRQLDRQLQTKVRDTLIKRCLKKGKFKLVSGLESNLFIDCKGITLHAPSLQLLCEHFWQTWQQEKFCPSVIAGVSVGGDPLATGLALAGWANGLETNVLLVRKEKKDHGGSQGRAVEGKPASELSGTFVLVEDVISTGSSSAKALRFLREENYPISAIWTILDREMGGKEALEKEFSLPVRSLFRLSELNF